MPTPRKSILILGLVFSALGGLIRAASAADIDLVIRNGRVADGTGNPAFFADIAVRDGRIVSVGRVTERGAAEIDAAGMVVAPGFIDVHTHSENVADIPAAANFTRMGVTTLVTGNCGGSASEIDPFFDKIERTRVAVNVATLFGHNTARSKAMGGSFNRPPSPEELDHMRELTDRAMKDGAVGLSTGLIYLPGTFSKTDEIVELAKVAARYDGIYVSHMRNEGTGINGALDELFTVAREAKIRAQVSHLKLGGNAAWGRSPEVLEYIEKARAEGLDVTQDQYVYTASSTGIGTLIPSEAREGGSKAFIARIDDPDQKAKIVEEMKATLKRNKREGYDYAVIASFPADRSLNGKNIPEAARILTGGDSIDQQIETILQLERRGGGGGVFHGMHEDDLQTFLRHPNTMFASDSGVRRQDNSVPHPRGYGNNARVLGRYVRELKALRLEEAVRKMTSLPAQTFRLKDRGVVREGAWADLAIFDPAAVREETSFNDPHHFATGFRAVLVNVVPVVHDDRVTDARPGMALRRR